MEIKEEITSRVNSIFDQLVGWRRHLHENPELSFQEKSTSLFIQKVLDELNVNYNKGFVEHGIVAHIQGTKSGPKSKVILRADIDALPIVEENVLPYASKNTGVMHACGHDIHTTCVLGAIAVLSELQGEFSGSVDFVFQPGEEVLPGGAKFMLEEGAIDLNANAILGQHVEPTLEAGVVGFHSGKFMASCDELHIEINGKGGHAATPEKLSDTVLAASQLVVNLQQICSRLKPVDEPSVLSIGFINAPGATNVIPNKVQLKGTFRALSEDWRNAGHQHILRIAESTARSFGVEIDMNIKKGYPPVFNHPELTARCISFAKEIFGEEHVVEVPKRMGGEDFGYYTQQMNACFWRLGVGNKTGENHGLHSSKFNPNEEGIKTGTALMAYLAIRLMKN